VKIRVGELRKILREASGGKNVGLGRLLAEESDSPAHAEGASGDSLDSQVDRYFMQYEGEAKKGKLEGYNWRSLVRQIVSEAEGDEAGTDTPDAAPMPAGEPPKLSSDDIDIESFVNNVVRLIENYDNLLEVQNTILRRSLKFIEKSYDDETVEAVKDVFRDDHGMVSGESSREVSADMYPGEPAERSSGEIEATPGGT